MNVYFISGLGADRFIFNKIQLPHGFTKLHLDWIRPQPDEKLEQYAERLSSSIEKDHPFALVGLSFGGMLAMEIARILPAALVVLISSIPSSRCLPPYYKFAGKFDLQRWVPISLLKSASLLKRLFTVETSEEKKYLRKAIRETDPGFIRWSLGAIVHWRYMPPDANYISIHGTADRLLPIRYTAATHVIRGGGHLMILTRSNDINHILNAELKKLQTVAAS